MNKKILVILGIILLAVLIIWKIKLPSKTQESPVVDSQTTSQTPAQTNVQTPSKSTGGTGWLTATFADVSNRGSFQYPPNLGTKYIGTTDWPPKIQVTNQQFVCAETGAENGPAGITTRTTINGHTYCLTRQTGGAAGSIYTLYVYAREVSNLKMATMTFSLRFPQCANYDMPQRGACQTEEDNFGINNTVDKIFSTLVVR